MAPQPQPGDVDIAVDVPDAEPEDEARTSVSPRSGSSVARTSGSPKPGRGDPSEKTQRPVHELSPIAKYGRFELLGRLAFGGMAEIFLARESSHAGAARHLVVKRILPNVADDERFVEMFLTEARIAIRLQHPNICHIYEFGQQDGTYFIAMEWVNGVSLGKLIKRARKQGGIPISVATRIVAQTAEALHYAHRARDESGRPLGIVHRDVSPQNVMVSYEGAVKLLDFGVAKATSNPTRTQAGIIKGKLAYMAPEQCKGEDIDARADVFALGVCLYEALVGRALYHRGTEYETLKAVIEEPVPSARAIRPELPEALDHIVQKALQKRAEDRYQTAAELQQALEQFTMDQREVSNAQRLADFLEKLYAEDIERGPLVDSTPFGHAARTSTPTPPPPAPVGFDAPYTGAAPPAPLSPHEATAIAVRAAQTRTWLGVAALLGTLAVIGSLSIAAWAVLGGPGAASSQNTPQTVVLQVPTPIALPPVPAPTPPSTPVAIPSIELGEIAPEETPSPATPRVRRDRPAPVAQQGGYLSINTRPWSKVYVGPRLLGTTPIGRANVPSGAVPLRIVDRDGETHRRSVQVGPGEEARAFFDLTAGEE